MHLTWLSLFATNSLVQATVPWGEKASASPSKYGWTKSQMKDADQFINDKVKGRSCLIVAKDGEIVFERSPAHIPIVGTPRIYEGWSMTKSVGSMLVLMAASQGKLDLDAEITKTYGIPSPKEYGVTTRMILTQIISSDEAPGVSWEYDSLGTKWLNALPKILQAATGRTATQWLQELMERAEFSEHFTWDAIETDWSGETDGAMGPCFDWARFGQILASGGKWGSDQIISTEVAQRVAEPMKAAPQNYYSNPCWGHGFWTNADKELYPGCCWEASRLPAPMCNNETFIDGAETGMLMMLGLYGQVVLAIPSQNVVVVSMGKDLRPIEPVRQGVYPAFCDMLGLPCSTPPPVPQPKCGEVLECLGISAQCYAGLPSTHGFNHSHPEPGGDACVECFQQRIMAWKNKEDLVEDIMELYCDVAWGDPFDGGYDISNFIECFCFDGDDPFPWESTTTTTPAPGPEPVPAKIYTTTKAPALPECNVPPECMDGLHRSCGTSAQIGGGYDCYWCVEDWWNEGAVASGCPDTGTQFLEFLKQSTQFCFCGTATPEREDITPVQIISLENQFHNAITVSSVEAGKYVPVCVAEPGEVCQMGTSLGSSIGIKLAGAETLAKRARNHLLVESADQMVQRGVVSNWTHRTIQDFAISKPTEDISRIDLWATTAPQRTRSFVDKKPNADRQVKDCSNEECCAAACIAAECDTWSLAPPGLFGNDKSCHIGNATSFSDAKGWSGQSLDEALCSLEQHPYNTSGLKLVTSHVANNMRKVRKCTTADCCQEACCDDKSECSAWGFHPTEGCWTGYRFTYAGEDADWVGGTGHTMHPPVSRIGHTGNKHDGFYKLVVDSAGAVRAEGVNPCTNPLFPVSYSHCKPHYGITKQKSCEAADCCEQACADSDCKAWSFSPNDGCWIGNVESYTYDVSYLSCSKDAKLEMCVAPHETPGEPDGPTLFA